MPRPLEIRATSSRRLTFSAPVRIAAASTEQPAAPRTFDAIAYTGEPMLLDGFEHPVVIDLDSAELDEQRCPALFNHNAEDADFIVGQVERMRIEPGPVLRTSGRFVVTDAPPERNHARKVIDRADAGYGWQISVGCNADAYYEVRKGESVKANGGREYQGPLVLAVGPRFREISFVVLGGDGRTSAVVAKHRTRIKGAAMSFEEWLLSMGFEDAASLSEVQRANLQLLYNEQYPAEGDTSTTEDAAATVTAEGDVMAPEDDEEDVAPVNARSRRPRVCAANRTDPIRLRREAEADETDRVEAIRRICASRPNAEIAVGPASQRRRVSLQAHAIREGWSAERTELEALRQIDRPSAPNLIVHGSPATATGPVIHAALAVALRQPDAEKVFKPEILQAAHDRFRGRIGLQQVLLIAAAQNGYHGGPGERLHNGNMRDVLRAAFRPEIRAAGGMSTVSLPGIFANVANKELLTGYMEEDQSWREVAAIKSVTDFKSVTSYRMLDDMAYEEVGPAGEIKHGKISEESYTRQAKTYAKMFALTRRDIINDDLGAFNDLRNRLGRGAAQKFNDVFWTEFLSDASTFWTTARTNYITGATTTLLTDGVGLGLGVKAFRQMTTPSGDGTKRVGGNPEILLVPPELEAAAEALYVSQNLTSVKASDANIYAGKYRPVVSTWLSDSSLTGYSTTAWYLLRNPAIMPAIVASFLNGMEAPTVEDSDADFDTLGVQFRGYHDFGCDQAEYLSGVKSKGAA